jgi:hypothetical protein
MLLIQTLPHRCILRQETSSKSAANFDFSGDILSGQRTVLLLL